MQVEGELDRLAARRAVLAATSAIVVGLAYLAAEDLLTASNVAVLASTAVGWSGLWYLLRRVDGPSVLGVARAFFLLHVVFVQIGCVVIYFASQSSSALDSLLLGFPVERSLVAVYVPLAGMAGFVAGVAIRARRRPPLRAVESPGAALEEASPAAVDTQVRRALVLLGLGVAYVAAATIDRGSLPLFEVLQGRDAERVRLDVHYGDTSIIFHSSIVQQVPLILVPAVAMLLWETSTAGTRRRWLAWAVAALSGLLLLNSLERTSMVIVGLWWGLVLYHRRGRLPWGVLAGLGSAFVAMTVLLHGGALSALRNQVFRRIAIVNAMVNYFVLERYPRDYGLLAGSSYTDYITDGILGSGSTFSKVVIRQIFPGQDVGTAPVGALTEAWANVGLIMVVLMVAQGYVFAALDDWLRHRERNALGRVYFAGMTLLVATTAYGGILSVGLSGGVASLTLLYLVLGARRRSAPA